MKLSSIILKIQTKNIRIGDVRKCFDFGLYKVVGTDGPFLKALLDDGAIATWMHESIGSDKLVRRAV